MATGSIQLSPYPDSPAHYSDFDDDASYTYSASTNSWHARFIQALRGHDYSPLPSLPQTSISPKKLLPRVLALIWVPIGVVAVMGMLYLFYPSSRYHYDYLSIPICHANISRRTSIDLQQWQTKYSPSALCTPTNRHSIPELTYSHSSTYDQFTSHRNASPPPFSLLPVTPIPGVCLEDYFSGQPCSCTGHENITAEPIDIVWAWVNGSDPLHIVALEETQRVNGYGTSKPKLYRNHNELKYSMRSALKHFRHGLGSFHLLTSDNAADVSGEGSEEIRYGQLPQWLSGSQWHDGNVSLDIQHHSQFFVPGAYSGPTFNSFAIESQLGDLCGVSENFIYMNDDYFFHGDVETEDFYTHFYGLVLRFEYWLVVPPQNPSKKPPEGEWRPLEYSSHLLSKRFGNRSRPYIVHAQKAISMPIMNEMAAGMWAEEFNATARRPFRGMNGHGAPGGDSSPVPDGDDVHPGFMFGNFLIDRAREALLWSWVVARIGGNGTPPSEGRAWDDEDAWTYVHAYRAWSEIGGEAGAASVSVAQPERETLSYVRVEDTVHSRLDHMESQYSFSSQDGCPLEYTYPNSPGHPPGLSSDPHYTSYGSSQAADCVVRWDKCFEKKGEPIATASEFFVHVAFEEVSCGDCMIRALMSASGPLGLSEFLPSPNRTIPLQFSFLADRNDTGLSSPHLPLTTEYHAKDFVLDTVMAPWAREAFRRRGWASVEGINVREWTMMVLQRYRYVVGELPFRFVSITDASEARSTVKELRENDKLRLVCINDDVTEESDVPAVDHALQGWFYEKWPTPAEWESVS
ncbi:uncharacterized protein BT62DRAFT_1001714 [Guyanagaster necrorhizus]|uniref:Stealth protein CR3 conserved region 3 domain-containing protein n=1 Tax=Guyanagaster necrorhizus TaxID=856835 RepID=A0A9P7W187_9AGAR|nr:uncharacterized protein BT62DRAFT_1001714 [Guyanagaster necrorhizus MCA 3950]KAG7450868.1 hypothetical protein BT62DRAFT_1001714 [Guyanagaster necrorhizus MCA 3950]